MVSVTVSPKFQITIPTSVRSALQVKAGQQFQMLALDGRIVLLPVEPAYALRGFLAGIDTQVERRD